MESDVHIGISGWSYDEWKNGFYKNVPRSRWLEHYADHFNALELNATFYRLQSEGTLKSWANRTPEDFIFCAKGHRYVTHTTKLADAAETVPRTRDNLVPLGDKLRVVLWQLPPTFEKDLNRLEEFAAVLHNQWQSVRHTIEFRHPTWMDEEVADLLENYDLVACQADAPDFKLWDVVTTDIVYVRLHGHTRKYASHYSTESLDRWADRINRWSKSLETYIFFDNTAEGSAPYDAQKLADRLDQLRSSDEQEIDESLRSNGRFRDEEPPKR